MVKDELLRRIVMLLCFGSAFLLLLIQWQTMTATIPLRDEALMDQEENAKNNAPQTLPQSPYSLIVELSDRRVYIYQKHQLKASYPIAIGQRGWETPKGSFHILDMQKDPFWRHPITGTVVPPGKNNPLGSRWISFWSNGRHQIGFHGTPEGELIGQAVSHGCLRMRNQDIQVIFKQLSVGTPVTVRD